MIGKILLVLVSVIIGGIIGIFCLLCCIFASHKDEIYDEIKFEEKGKKK